MEREGDQIHKADKLADLSPEEREAHRRNEGEDAGGCRQKQGSRRRRRTGQADRRSDGQAGAQAPDFLGEAAIAAAAATSKDARAVPAEASAAVIEESTRNAGSPHPAPVASEAVEAKAVAEAVHQADHAVGGKPAGTVQSNGAATNGANGGTAVAAAPILVAPPPVFVEDTPEQKARKTMNRREFLTYAWGGAALVLLALEVGVGTLLLYVPALQGGRVWRHVLPGPGQFAAAAPTHRPCRTRPASSGWSIRLTKAPRRSTWCARTWVAFTNGRSRTTALSAPAMAPSSPAMATYIEGPAPRSLDTFLVVETAMGSWPSIPARRRWASPRLIRQPCGPG